MDFTQRLYRKLCRTLSDEGYQSLTLKEYLESQSGDDQQDRSKNVRRVVLRHDVDRLAGHALALAKIEHQEGLRSSYYFRIPRTFVPKTILQIAELGHEVGFHYESLDHANGDLERGRDHFKRDLERLKALVPVHTATMHGNPLTKHDNRDLWKDQPITSFELVGEGYLSVDFTQILYYSDTGRTWNESGANLKDVIPGDSKRAADHPQATTTQDLIEIIKQGVGPLYISSHPNRWKKSFPEWVMSWVVDAALNMTKRIIIMFR